MDINEDAVKQTERNIKQNADKLSGTEFNVYSGDAKSICKTIGANTADIAVCNPPYFSTGKKPLNSNRSLARHDKTLTLDDLAAAATKILKFGGIIYFCYPAVKTAAAVTIFENNNFRVKEIKFITNKKGVYLTLFKCKKGGGHGTKIII
jgi:tRNA1(Val) A37 N6-methylase TrmN6